MLGVIITIVIIVLILSIILSSIKIVNTGYLLCSRKIWTIS